MQSPWQSRPFRARAHRASRFGAKEIPGGAGYSNRQTGQTHACRLPPQPTRGDGRLQVPAAFARSTAAARNNRVQAHSERAQRATRAPVCISCATQGTPGKCQPRPQCRGAIRSGSRCERYRARRGVAAHCRRGTPVWRAIARDRLARTAFAPACRLTHFRRAGRRYRPGPAGSWPAAAAAWLPTKCTAGRTARGAAGTLDPKHRRPAAGHHGALDGRRRRSPGGPTACA